MKRNIDGIGEMVVFDIENIAGIHNAADGIPNAHASRIYNRNKDNLRFSG